MRATPLVLALAVASLGAASSGGAQPFTFVGSRTATNIPPGALDVPRCGAAPNVLLSGIFGIGTSNLGAFTTEESNCLNPPAGQLFNGLWRFTFSDASTLFGTDTGTVGLPPVGGVAPVSLLFTVTGGTGRFGSATGDLSVGGQIQFNRGGTTTSSVSITGSIATVPEPSTVALVGLGLGSMLASGAGRRALGRRRGA